MPRVHNKKKIKPPILPLVDLHESVMDSIDRWNALVGIFIIGGKMTCMKRESPRFDHYASLLTQNFVGVYRPGCDARHVLEDLKCFYGDAQ